MSVKQWWSNLFSRSIPPASVRQDALFDNDSAVGARVQIENLCKVFQEGDWALLYNSWFKDFKGKLMKSWLGPYLIEKCHESGFSQIRTIDEEGIPLLANGYRLKVYRKPMSKEEFISTINRGVNVIGRVIAPSSHRF